MPEFDRSGRGRDQADRQNSHMRSGSEAPLNRGPPSALITVAPTTISTKTDVSCPGGMSERSAPSSAPRSISSRITATSGANAPR